MPAEHPEPTPREIALDPVILAGFRELLDILGLTPDALRTASRNRKESS